jgi:hypothetical protein
MKKLLLSLLAAAAVAPAFAQPGLADGWLLYGSGSYFSQRGETERGATTQDDDHLRALSIAPGLGYSFTERWAAGINLELYGSKIDYLSNNNVPGTLESTRDRDIIVGPFVRYTMPVGQHFYWFTQADFGYITGKTRNVANGTPDTETEIDRNGVRGRLFPAVGFNFSRTMSAAFNIGGIGYGYQRIDYGANVEGKQSALDVTLGQVFGFTVQKYFGGRKYGYGRMPMDETRRMDTSDDEDDDDRPRRRRRNRDMDDE